MIAGARKAHFLLFAALLCWAPLPLGSNRPWSWMLLEVGAGSLMLGWALLNWLDRTPAPVGVRWFLPPLLLFSAMLAWGFLQASTFLPDPLRHPLWHEVADALGRQGGSIAVDRSAAQDGVLREMSYGAVFFLALQYGRAPRQAERLVVALAAAGAAYAAYGLSVFLSGSETVLGLDKWAYRGYLTGSFVNRNNFASFTGLVLLSQIALARRHFGGQGWRAISRMLLVEGDGTAWLLAVGSGATLAALLLTGSRGGCFATLYGGFILLLALRPVSGRTLAAAAALPLLILAGLTWVLPGSYDSSELSDRLEIDGLALQSILAHPLTGAGLGGFPAIFALTRSSRFLTVWDNVHDTYLQMALELGIPAALCLFSTAAWSVGRCLRGIAIRRTVTFPALGLAVSALIGAHALIDFGAEIPAVAMFYAALLGVAVAQSWPNAIFTGAGPMAGDDRWKRP